MNIRDVIMKSNLFKMDRLDKNLFIRFNRKQTVNIKINDEIIRDVNNIYLFKSHLKLLNVLNDLDKNFEYSEIKSIQIFKDIKENKNS